MSRHRFAYPLQLTPDDDGRVLVTFPDVAEAMTDGADRAEALDNAADCLVAALGAYVERDKPLPRPSPARGRALVTLPALQAAKLALYEAMRAGGVGNVALARRLGIDERAVRRLLDLDHRSHIGAIEDALAALGQQIELVTAPLVPA